MDTGWFPDFEAAASGPTAYSVLRSLLASCPLALHRLERHRDKLEIPTRSPMNLLAFWGPSSFPWWPGLQFYSWRFCRRHQPKKWSFASGEKTLVLVLASTAAHCRIGCSAYVGRGLRKVLKCLWHIGWISSDWQARDWVISLMSWRFMRFMQVSKRWMLLVVLISWLPKRLHLQVWASNFEQQETIYLALVPFSGSLRYSIMRNGLQILSNTELMRSGARFGTGALIPWCRFLLNPFQDVYGIWPWTVANLTAIYTRITPACVDNIIALSFQSASPPFWAQRALHEDPGIYLADKVTTAQHYCGGFAGSRYSTTVGEAHVLRPQWICRQKAVRTKQWPPGSSNPGSGGVHQRSSSASKTQRGNYDCDRSCCGALRHCDIGLHTQNHT